MYVLSLTHERKINYRFEALKPFSRTKLYQDMARSIGGLKANENNWKYFPTEMGPCGCGFHMRGDQKAH